MLDQNPDLRYNKPVPKKAVRKEEYKLNLMILASIIADSISPSGVRITTIEYSAPRFILAEFNTHRVFSRNAGSSRAIPTSRIIERVELSPVMPIWTRNKPGMQGIHDVTDAEIAEWNEIWLDARNDAVKHAKRLADKKAHKQSVNRILEPYMYYRGVVTSTEWDNWFDLRDHEAAQPEIAILAQAFREAMEASTPRVLQPGEYHLPYITIEEAASLTPDQQFKVSVARCARVSYKTFDDDRLSNIDKDYELYQGLLDEKHFSPFEHQATPLPALGWHFQTHENTWSGNYRGWKQFRKTLEVA